MGAGLAGLTGAFELLRAGHDVTVLEARMSFWNGEVQGPMEADHIILTIPFSVLRTVDMGSSISESKRNAIARLHYESIQSGVRVANEVMAA